MAVTPKILTRHHAHHYLGFADTQWRLFDKEEQPRIKPLLYTFRVLLTGIHLMRTGAIEANLGLLNQIYKLPFLPDLIARKVEGAEQQTVAPNDVMSYAHQFEALRERLVMEASRTSLPEAPTAQAALNDILIRVRLGTRA
jgi:predicted nucleotidyltransferase